MRNYKEEIAIYHLPEDRYKELRQYCLNSEEKEQKTIKTALYIAFKDDQIAQFIYKHVTSTEYAWDRLEAEQIPCSRCDFNVYRAKFYYELDKLLQLAKK